jgi:hypothetical protein
MAGPARAVRHAASLVDDRLSLFAEATRTGARAYDAPRALIAARALALRATAGFGPGEALAIGLLDPALPLREAAGAFASKRRVLQMQRRLNPAAALRLTEDKREFARAVAAHGLPAPRTIGRIDGGDPAFDAERWAAAHSGEAGTGLVIKPVAGFHGRGVIVAERRGDRYVDLADESEWDLAGLVRRAAAAPGPQVVQERVVNHPGVVALNPVTALQTARITTLVEAGATRILTALLRLAAPGAVVDNYSHPRDGAMIARLDPGEGVVFDVMARAPDGAGTVVVERSPRTGEPLRGRRIPGWGDALDLARRAAAAFAPLRTVGWDVAITPSGPVLVEGNARWDPPPFADSGAMLRRLRAAAASGLD